MKNWIWIVVLVVVATALGAQDAKKPKGVLSTLKVGQAVSLKDRGSAYSISFFEDEVPLSHTVVEVGDGFRCVEGHCWCEGDDGAGVFSEGGGKGEGGVGVRLYAEISALHPLSNHAIINEKEQFDSVPSLRRNESLRTQTITIRNRRYLHEFAN